MEGLSEDGDDSVEITLRDPIMIATRTIILSALCHRAFIEIAAAENDTPDLDEDRFDLLAWLYDENLFDHASARERDTFHAVVGTLAADETLEPTWSAEALAALCWSLSLIPNLPAYDQPARIHPLFNVLPEPGSSCSAFLSKAEVLSEDPIAAARETAELWYWRATMQELLDDASRSERDELLVAIRDTVVEGASLGLLPQPISDDFALHGGTYAQADNHEVLVAIAEWRLRAFNWLCGFGNSWDTVPLDL
jgi:hypothetical protein